MKRSAAASICLLAFALPAVAAELVVLVRTKSDAGEAKVVTGARVAVLPADQTILADRALGQSAFETGADGKVTVPRPAGAVVVVAGIPGRGTGYLRVPADQQEAVLLLPPEASLTGQVKGPDGKAVAGAEVFAVPERPEDTGAFFGPGSLVHQGLTDGEGRFTFFRLAADRRYRLQARRGGLAPDVRRDVDPGGEPIVLTLRVGATVMGLVISLPGGEPVPGAQVALGEVQTRTDAEGRFRLVGVPAGAWRLLVTAAGRVHVEEQEIVVSDEDVRDGFVIRVNRVGRMRGRVLTPATEPAVGAEILLRYPRDPELDEFLPESRIVRVGETDAEGNFDARDLLPAQGVDLIVRHPDFAPTVHFGYNILAARSLRTVVLLNRGATLSGEVQDQDGEGIAGARVVVMGEREDLTEILATGATDSPTARETVTGESGAFSIANLSGGVKSVVVFAEGLLPSLTRGIELAQGSVREKLLIHLGPGVEFEGRVLDPDGAPVEGATIVLMPEMGVALEATSGTDGRFRRAASPPGRYAVRVTRSGFADWTLEEIHLPAEKPIEVKLVRTLGLAGQVLAESTQDPALPATVRALRLEPPSPLDPDRSIYRTVAQVRAEPPGATFFLPDLAPGIYRVEAWTEDGRTGFVDGVAADGADGPLVVRVFPGWAISGRVLSPTGLGVEGAIVAVRDMADEPGPLTAATDSAGLYRIEGVRAGFHTLVVAARDFAPAIVESVEVRQATDTQVDDIVLTEGGAVRGVVTGPDGQLRVGARVRLESAALGGAITASTDERGIFVIPHVSAGTWLLTLTSPELGGGGSRHERLLEIAAGEELFLEIGTGTGTAVTGQVRWTGVPVQHARVTAMVLRKSIDTERELRTTRTDGDGNYLLGDLPPGPIMIEVHPAGSSLPPVRFTLNVLSGPIHVQDLVLPDSGIEGSIHDLDTGDPIPGVTLRVTTEVGGGAGTFLEQLARDAGEIRTDADGGFRLPALPEGYYRIDAFRDGYGQSVVEGIHVVPGGYTPVRIEMPPAGVLVGRVLDEQMRPLTDARVSFLNEEGAITTSEPYVRVDSNGRFSVKTLRTGTYTVQARATGYAFTSETDVDVFPGGKGEVVLILPREGRIEVIVWGAGGLRAEGAKVTVHDFWGRVIAFPPPPVGLHTPHRDPAVSNKEGVVTIHHLPAGIYTLRATAPGHKPGTTRVRVLDGEFIRAAIVVTPH